MSHEVSRDRAHALIDVRYRDNVTIENRLSAMQETLRLLAETGFHRILIDYNDAHNHATFAENNSFASVIANDPVLRHCRIAFVGSHGQQFNAIVEPLADARRYPFQRFFDRETAITWLLTDAPARGLLQD